MSQFDNSLLTEIFSKQIGFLILIDIVDDI